MKSWKWLSDRRRQKSLEKPEPPSPLPELALPALLHDHVQKGYDREIDDNESIWRSLPLFAVLMGFAGASLNFIATRAPGLDRGWWALVVYALIIINVGLYGWGIRHIFTIIRPRKHRYIANDRTVRSFALSLLSYHLATAASESDADVAASKEIREYLIEELAEASAQIQALNQLKAYARAQALFWLGVGFIFWFVVSSIIIVDDKIFQSKDVRYGSESRAAGAERGVGAAGPAGPGPARAAPPAVRRGGGESPVPPQALRVSGGDDPTSNGVAVNKLSKEPDRIGKE